MTFRRETEGWRKLADLRHSAETSAKFRGHVLDPFVVLEHAKSECASCAHCGAEVTIVAWPAANEIEIGGTAVAVNCVPARVGA